MFWDIALGLWCFILGLIASLLTPYHRMLIRRLKNINEVAEDAFDGSVDSENAILFITLESNLNIRKERERIMLLVRQKRRK